ncbi:MAG: triphosphoribosyl-dephospho-CoA synthase [Methanobrevibacter sp.]|uniref:triphosphoribosyl-dephospho-CoA synthase n=1 Tax=Methanobrevibacter sp. TaxID=66852 RepID=UPI0026E0182E|nr:triphosphoribosyl-dephospho-CoA synthase [Methanobrevibacter sp.]MDO5848711.1 triphosphoribosyl-dephospho-CoA synthase [Methanobrevibacter sp.]
MDSKTIAKIAQIASCLEVSGFPKPGNVHRTRDYDDMVFEDFLISGVVIGDTIREVAENVDKDDLASAQLGKYILEAVKETDNWIANNTNLGIVMLLVPISAAAAISEDFYQIRENVVDLMAHTTVDDAINLYDAINIADAGGMGEQDEYDVAGENAKQELRENNQTMYDVLEISAPWDRLASELTTTLPVCFEIGFKEYSKLKKETSLNMSGVLTFLKILSTTPDTLISRKYGDEKAEEVSEMAAELLGYVDAINFMDKVREFDDYLFENKLNPGTTADLTAASIMLSLLSEKF